jgi:hypothetical protein
MTNEDVTLVGFVMRLGKQFPIVSWRQRHYVNKIDLTLCLNSNFLGKTYCFSAGGIRYAQTQKDH